MTDPRTHHAQSTAVPPTSWPPGVRPISLEGLDHIGVGPNGDLHWDGKPIVVRKGLTLSTFQNIGAVIVGVAAVVAAGAAAVSAYADLQTISATATPRTQALPHQDRVRTVNRAEPKQ